MALWQAVRVTPAVTVPVAHRHCHDRDSVTCRLLTWSIIRVEPTDSDEAMMIQSKLCKIKAGGPEKARPPRSGTGV